MNSNDATEIRMKRARLQSEIIAAQTVATQQREHAEYRESRAEGFRAHAKVARANLNRLAAIEDEKAAEYRDEEKKALELFDRLNAELEAFDNSPESLTIEQRLSALEARLQS